MKQPISSLSLLASSCLAIISVSATAAPEPKVPGVIDSSTQRVIRAAKPDAQLTQPQRQNSVQDLNENPIQDPNLNPFQDLNLNQGQNSIQPDAQASQNIPNQVQLDPNTLFESPVPQPEKVATENLPQPAVHVYEPSTIDIANVNGIDLSSGQLPNIPTPSTSVSNASFVTTSIIPQTTSASGGQLDVSMLDDFIEEVSPNARHYPTNFPNKSQEYNTKEKIKLLTKWIDSYATAPNASYEVLLRAAKLNAMGRNLDLGSDYAVRASKYVANAIDRQPNSAEANFLYGMMLTEGGGFKEGKKYLDKAASLGYTEAEQSLAQSDLLSDRRNDALERLRSLQSKMPNDPIIKKQIQIVEDGKYYIWDIPAPDIHVKPLS